MKKCSICKVEKDFNEFPFQNKKENKLMSACKNCKSNIQKEKRINNNEWQRQKDRDNYQKFKERRILYAREYRKQNPQKIRESNLKSKYGITQLDYDKMLISQNNKCAICDRDMHKYGKIFCVDHNHSTGNVRGLLCDPCNYGLGFYEKHKDKYLKYLNNNDN
jgi:hypothetical protein